MVNVKKSSGIYQLHSKQIINASLEEVWNYFSSPQNLDNLTPDDMAFEITNSIAGKMYQGQIITYKIEVLPKIKQFWVTEISLVKDQKMFIDEQRFGPYAMWHHEHHFKPMGQHQVEMVDIVSYKLPLGLMGRIFAGNFIKYRVKSIFDFRRKKVDEIFK